VREFAHLLGHEFVRPRGVNDCCDRPIENSVNVTVTSVAATISGDGDVAVAGSEGLGVVAVVSSTWAGDVARFPCAVAAAAGCEQHVTDNHRANPSNLEYTTQ
jgi:hypothetical protein